MQGWQHITALVLSHQLSLQPVGEQHMHNVPTCSTKWQAWLKRTCMSTHHAFFLLAAEMCNKNARTGGLETACLVLRFSCSTAHTVDANAVAQAPLWVRVALSIMFCCGAKINNITTLFLDAKTHHPQNIEYSPFSGWMQTTARVLDTELIMDTGKMQEVAGSHSPHT